MPALTTRPAVPICTVGHWSTATGEWDVTAEDLRDAVLAQHDPTFRSAVLKIGHTDPRFTDGQILGDGEPAVGRLENLRTTPDGQTLLADLVGVPAWLDEVMASAYPSRSIEAELGVRTDAGAEYRMVVTGLALLGVTAPAIQSLGDIADLYGTTTDVDAWVAARSVAASALPDEGNPMPGTITHRRLGTVIVASASIDELVQAFEAWAATVPTLGRDCWVRDLYTDRLVATVWLADDSQYWQVSWTESDGQFTFSDPVQVRPTYEPVPQPAAASTRVPGAASTNGGVRLQREWPITVQFARGRETQVSTESPEEIRVPIPTALAERLGVPADADDATLAAAVDELERKASEKAPEPDPDDEDTDQDSGETADDAPSDAVADLVAAKVKKAEERIAARYGAQLEAATTKLAQIEAEKAAAEKTRVITAAVADGKIRPADREQWGKDYDEAPKVVTGLLARIARGSAVPVTAAGHAGAPDTSDDDAFYNQLFGAGAKV
jgi:hypothetical protein